LSSTKFFSPATSISAKCRQSINTAQIAPEIV
jgi:hypothetical protein